MTPLKHSYLFILPFLCGGCVCLFPPPVIAQQASRPPKKLIEKHTDVAPNRARLPPHVFTLGGLSADRIKSLKSTAGIVHVEELASGRSLVLYQPYIKGTRMRLKQCEELYEHLVIKGVVGRTKWTHGGLYSGRSAGVFSSRASVYYGMMFNDARTGNNGTMGLSSYPDIPAEQVEHEMLRDAAGTNLRVVRCGKGYVIVSTAERGTFTVWQPTPHQYVRIDNSFDKKMVAAYIERLGSIIPANYKVDVDKWVNNEIKWRLIQLNDYYLTWGEVTDDPASHLEIGFRLTPSFPEIRQMIGVVKRGDTIKLRWQWLEKVGPWLWANRNNFKYGDRTRGYILKRPDLFDPKKPTALPKELRPPPLPTRTRKHKDVLREVRSKR
jgi:hypothetical protein